MKLKAIILDFDGVIVESNRIKHDAFSEIFSEHPEHYDEMMSYHYAHNHVDRHEKFKYFIEKVQKREYVPEEGRQMVARFAGLTREKIIKSPYVAGALEFIERFSRKYPIYIASATPLDELKLILEARGLTKFFKGVYGAPTPKVEMFADLMKKERAGADEVLFIGDSPEDCEVAKKSGINFLARVSDHKIDPGQARSFRDMKSLLEHLCKETNNDALCGHKQEVDQ